MIVVSDTTPLRYLAVLGLLDVLPRLFEDVHCPAMVIAECNHPRAPAALREWVNSLPSWLIVDDVRDVEPELLRIIDAGEAAAITLAMRLHSDLILIDERKGRHCAHVRGFATAGTLNILAQAGARGWLDYHLVVERLKAETNFRVTQAVVDAAWQTARQG